MLDTITPSNSEPLNLNNNYTEPKIVEYKLLKDIEVNSTQRFNDLINKHLDDGWTLYGGFKLIPTSTGAKIYQAMVKYILPEIEKPALLQKPLEEMIEQNKIEVSIPSVIENISIISTTPKVPQLPVTKQNWNRGVHTAGAGKK